MSLSRSAINYDLLVQMAATIATLYDQSLTGSFADFVSKGIATNHGLREALIHLYATDGNLGTTSLATRSPFLTEILLPDNLPELSGGSITPEMAHAISFHQGLIAVAPSTEVGSSPETWPLVYVIPLSRSSLRRVRRTLHEQIRQLNTTPPLNMGAQFLRDKFDYYID